MTTKKDYEEHSCGCVSWRQEDELYIEPCALDCLTLASLKTVTDEDDKDFKFEQNGEETHED